MQQHRVNYDEVAATYDARYTGSFRYTIPAVLQELLRLDTNNPVLEVGCGTGFWLGSFDGERAVYGLDLSPEMLRKGKERHVDLICGTADQLPFRNDTFDLVYCVNALHHFAQKEAFFSEAARLLLRDGTLAVIGMDPHGNRDKWYIYDYFEGTYETDLLRFPSVAQIAGWMYEAGFVEVRHRVVDRILKHLHGRAVLNHSTLQKTGTSQLILLSDEAYRKGIAKLKADLDNAEAQGTTLTFPLDISLVLVAGRREA
jgi:SAM-dependent methyltransferase